MNGDVYLCLHCWRSMAVRDAGYRCPRCASEPDPWSLEDEARPVRHLLDDGPWARVRRVFGRRVFGKAEQEPHCPRHPDAALHFYCACGERLLPSLRVDAGQLKAVGLAGPRASGKSHLLVAMIHALQLRARARVALNGLGTTEPRFRELSRRILEAGERLPATSEAADPHRHFAWEVLTEPGVDVKRRRVLAVYDLAGEFWARLHEEPPETLRRYLASLGSVALLVDGAVAASDLRIPAHDAWNQRPEPGDHGANDRFLLRQLIDGFGRGQARRSRLAIVLTKSDLFWDHADFRALSPAASELEPAAYQSLIRGLLERSGRRPLLMSAERHFGEVRLFATSSLGFRPSGEHVEGDQLRYHIEPHGVVELLLWLLELEHLA